jgi:hypothetical protein
VFVNEIFQGSAWQISGECMVLVSECQFHLGATGTHPHIAAYTCYCGRHVQGSAIDHAMACSFLTMHSSVAARNHCKAAFVNQVVCVAITVCTVAMHVHVVRVNLTDCIS